MLSAISLTLILKMPQIYKSSTFRVLVYLTTGATRRGSNPVDTEHLDRLEQAVVCELR